MQIKKYLILVLVCSLLCSCSHIDTQRYLYGQNVTTDNKYKPVASISAYNYGYYLFGVWPIVSGSLESEYLTMFNDNVTVNDLTKVIVDKAAYYKADKLLDVTSKQRNFPIIYFLFLISLREVNVGMHRGDNDNIVEENVSICEKILS